MSRLRFCFDVSMGMIMQLGLVPRMFVVMGSVVSSVIMVMYMWVAAVRVLMNVLVQVFMHMGMGMFMGVFHVSMVMLVFMDMGVLMGMKMFVFMFAFHGKTSLVGIIKHLFASYWLFIPSESTSLT